MTFLKVVQWHTWGVVGSLVIVLLQIFSWFRKWNSLENRLIFGKVNAYKNCANFLGHPVVQSTLEHWHRHGYLPFYSYEKYIHAKTAGDEGNSTTSNSTGEGSTLSECTSVTTGQPLFTHHQIPNVSSQLKLYLWTPKLELRILTTNLANNR